MARLGRQAVGSASTLSPEDAVLRGLAILAIVWQGLWILPDPTLWPTRAGSPVSSLLLGAVIVTWLGVVAATWGPWASARRRGIAEGVNLIVLYAAAVDLFLDLQVDAGDGWRQGASLVNLAVGLTGLLLRGRNALPIALTAVLVEGALLITLDLGRLPTLTASSEVLYPLYALAIAAATIGGRRALLRAARRTRVAQADLAEATASAEAMREVELRLREQARRLHETVLNTLTAIARGGLADDPAVTARIRERSAQSASVLASFADIGPDPRPPVRERWALGVEPAVAALREAGVVVDLDAPVGCRPPDDVGRAFMTAMVEALLNVQRHARARRVVIRIDGDGERALRVEITDDGVGFDPQRRSDGFGLSESIRAPLADVGGSARITSAPDLGTTVQLEWSRLDDAREPVFDTTAFVRPVLLAFGAFTVASAILTLSGFTLPWIGVAALLVAVVAGLVLAVSSRSGILPASVVIGVCLSAPLILRLQVLGLGTGSQDSWADWSSEAIVGLLLVIAAAGPWWGWIAALATWVLTQGDVVGELLRPGTAVIIAGGLFARSVRANAEASARATGQRAVELASALSDAESIRRTAERYAALAESDAQELLRGIADGALDPRDDAVRHTCADEERFIRSVMRLDPAANALHGLASRLAIAAHRRRLPLEIDLADAPPPDDSAIAALESRIMPVLAGAALREPARLTARVEGEELVVRLVLPVQAGAIQAVEQAESDDRIVVHAGGEEPVVMWELRHG